LNTGLWCGTSIALGC